MSHYYSNGKLLITGEYTVLDGALALAVPTKYGQSLTVAPIPENNIIWKSIDSENNVWFEDSFPIEEIASDFLKPRNDISKRIIQILNTAKELDYNPKLLVAQNAGYTDPKFIATMGSKAEGVITRSPFNTDLATTIPMIGTVNELFKTHSGGRDLSDVPARAFTGFMALANAINNAGSTDPEKIRQALVDLDMSSDSLIVPYRGIKFGADGQNEKTRGILMQVQGGKYCTVYPFELAACKLQYPMPTWAQK